MATKKISELEAITEADGSDALVIVDVSEGKTNKITKNNLLKGSGHTIEMSLNENYQIVLKLKNAEGTELSTATIDLPNENAITNISYSNGTLTLTKQSGTTTEVDITGLIEGLVTETDFETFTTELNQVLQELDETKADAEDVEALQTRVTELEQENEDLKKNQLTNIPEIATSHYLQDSADSRFRKFIPIGRSVQESTTGKNKLKVENVGTYNGITSTKNTDGSINLKGTCTGAWFKVNDYDNVNIPAGTYTFSIDTTLEKYIRLNFVYEDDTVANGFVILAGQKKATQTIDKKIIKIFIEFPSATNFSIDTTVKFQLEQGSTATDYEPYTGGEPAPSPSFPFPINNTGDNGSVNEEIQNANIWDEEWEVGGINSSNGENYVSTSIIRTKNYISVQPNTQYYIKNSTDYAWFYAYDKDKNFIGYAFGSSSSVANEIKTTFSNCYYLRFQCRSQYGTTYKNDICINVSNPSINGTYIPHSEQNISFPLSQGQKLMEGDYLADDGIHHVSGEMLFDGSSDENWIYNPTYAYFYITTSGFKSADFCDNYSKETSETLTKNHFRFNPNNGNLYIKDERFTSASSFKTNLATNNIILQGELAEEQTEDFTEAQQTAWEQIKKARTYKNITHISSEDETPANVDIEYVVDINTIDDRITALEAKVDLLEE